MPGHAQYTLGPVTCIDNVVDNARVGYHQMASYFLNLRWRRRAENEKPKSNFQLRVDSRNVRECTCLETHIPRNGHTLCRQNATITHFVKFVTTVFSLCMAAPVGCHCHCQSRTHRGIEQTVKTNSSLGNFGCLRQKLPIRKYPVVSVTLLCVRELIVEQNIPLALL